MRRELTIKTCSLAGTSDLTVVAPIRKGLVPSLDAVTYKSRVKLVLKTLHLGRAMAHEFDFLRVLSDAVERVGRIHSVRIAVLEPDDLVLLAVTFDGAWESYVRVIWQKVARLLDLIFCNTEDYVNGWESTYADWGKWLRSRQAETSFLYALPALTVDDVQYLRMQERFERRTIDGALALTQMSIPSAEAISSDLLEKRIDPTDMRYSKQMTQDGTLRFAVEQGLRSLVGLYGLAGMYPPGTGDGIVLRRAALELLPEFAQKAVDDSAYNAAVQTYLDRFEEQILWLFNERTEDPTPQSRQAEPLPAHPPALPPRQVQGGILATYPDVDHGCLLLISFASRPAVASLLAAFTPTLQGDPFPKGSIAFNIAFTAEGLRAAGLSEDEISSLPQEFVEGMERRAGVLGDVRNNHPLRWRRPALNWAAGPGATDVGEDAQEARVDMAAVHAVLQLRLSSNTNTTTAQARQLLYDELTPLVNAHTGIRPLSLQWMQRMRNAQGDAIEHFGFLDANSQPVFDQQDNNGKIYRDNQAHLGEVLVGYANEADHPAADIPPPSDGQPIKASSLLRNGSFLVIRKLRQDVPRFNEVIAAAVADARRSPEPAVSALGAEDFKAKMMGRWGNGDARRGQPLVPYGNSTNDFTYESDSAASRCPFHSHTRRANPREVQQPALETFGGRRPRLFRRGMPYGPAFGPADADAERGLVFMTYNASIGEQYEVVQRWLSAGNSSASYSGQGDPLLGVAEPGRQRVFRFEASGCPVSIALDSSDVGSDDPAPMVRLEWGVYLFAPAVRILQFLEIRAANGRSTAPLWSVEIGANEIDRLRKIEATEGANFALPAWKQALEDIEASADFTSASIWAAIRHRYGGVLRTPFGVLVASAKLVKEVLQDEKGSLTVNGYLPRMRKSFGEIYLGHDKGEAGAVYEQQSKACNDEILRLDADDAYTFAYKTTNDELDKFVETAKQLARPEAHWSLTLDVHEIIVKVLAKVCEAWFGLSEAGGLFRSAGYRWDWRPGMPATYPGHFMAPSRYYFQPHPGKEVERIGRAHGTALHDAMTEYLVQYGATLKAPIARAVLDSKVVRQDPELAARTLIGALVGFVPTVDGNLRRIVSEWLLDESLWRLRAAFASSPSVDRKTAAGRYYLALHETMQERGVPEVLWRTAVLSHSIGAAWHRVDVQPGDIVVASLISATHEHIENGTLDVTPIFGGARGGTTHPTHACPGYSPALQVMLGFLAALAETQQPLSPGPTGSTFTLRGPTSEPGAVHVVPSGGSGSHLSLDKVTAFGGNPLPKLFSFGDSWLTQNSFVGSLVDSLSNRYNFDGGHASLGMRLQQMADPGEKYLTEARKALTQGNYLAVLLDGGGDDVVYTPNFDIALKPLYKMILKNAPAGSELIEAEVAAFIDGSLKNWLYTVVAELRQAAPTIPIFIHGYDNPFPDGRHNWLECVFYAKQIYDPGRGADVMSQLIGRLNTMIARVASGFADVYHIPLNGRLATAGCNLSNHATYWCDELHPTSNLKNGFGILANACAAQIKAVIGV